MDKIGEGWFYEVFDTGDQQVLKKRRTFKDISNSITAGEKVSSFLNFIRAYFYGSKCGYVIGVMQSKLANSTTLQHLLGNPIFVNDADYKQDKVVILKDIFANRSEDENKKTIDLYIQNVIECWKNGFADRIFNFTLNNGISASGNMVLIDFNEVTFSKEEVLKDIASKRWQKSGSLKHISNELKEYYLNEMDSLITKNQFDQCWNQYTKV